MTIRKFYIGMMGPYLYDDEELINDRYGDFSGQYRSALTASGPISVSGTITPPVEVANIDNPVELINYSGGASGGLLVVYQPTLNQNEYTLYVWDSYVFLGDDSPWVVRGKGGFWIAIGGKYNKYQKGYTGALYDGMGIKIATIENGLITSVEISDALLTEDGYRILTESSDYLVVQ